MANTPYPLAGALVQPSYYAIYPFYPHDADPDDVHPNRYSIYYDGDTVNRIFSFVEEDLPTTYTVRALLPSANGGIAVGDIVKTGAVSIVFPTPPLNFPYFTVGTAGLSNDFPPGAYKVYLTGGSTDTRTFLAGPNNDVDMTYGPSYGVSQFVVLRTHPSAVDIRTLNSTYAFSNWKPNGFGRSDATVDAGGSGGGEADMILRNALSMGVGRTEMYGTAPDVNGPNFKINPSAAGWDETNAHLYFSGVVKDYWLNPTNPEWADTIRSRTCWMNYVFYFTAYDAVQVGNDGSQASFLTFANIYPKTPSIDATKLFVKVYPSSGGATIEVYYPDSSTLVESHSGIPLFNTSNTGVSDSINGSSNYIRAYNGGGTTPITMTTPVVIGNNNRTQLITLVQSVGPLGCTRFEGPENEPGTSEETAHQFWLMQAAVAASGVLGVKAMGAAPVSFNRDWSEYFGYLTGTAGLTKDDFGLSFHDYNTITGGNFQQGRTTFEEFLVQVRAFGLEGIEMWQTEANFSASNASDIGTAVYVPNHQADGIRHVLLWEQYGIPRENNPHWYDVEHSFWSRPWFITAQGQTCQPLGVLYSVLGQETFRKAHHHRVDFGSVVANYMFCGSLYGDPVTGSTMVLCCASYMPNSTVTLKINGTTSAITYVDGVGITATATPDGSGHITVPVSYIPTYIRLPAGVTASVYSVRDHGNNPNPSVSSCYLSTSLGGSPAPQIAVGAFMDSYTGSPNGPGVVQSASDPPDTAEIKFSQNFAVDRLVVFCAPLWQKMCGLINYTVDTWNGSTWTTNTTVTKSIPASFRFGDGGMYGTVIEQLNDGQWIEDIVLAGGPITCQGIRISVASANDLTFGGARDALADSVLNSWGASTDTPRITLQRMEVISGTAFAAPSGYAATVLADSPVAYWKFNEDSSATKFVSQVNSPALDSTVISNITPGSGDNVVPSTGDSSALIENTSAYIEIPNNAARNVGDTFTLEAWIKVTNGSQFFTGPEHKLFDNAATAGGSYRLRVGGSGKTFTLYRTSFGVDSQICRGTALVTNINTPYHLVATKSGGTTKLYINGQDVSGSVTDFTCSDNGSTLRFSDVSQRGFFELSHAAIYPTALTAAQVEAHYLAGVSTNAPTSVHPPFVEGSPVTGGQLQCSMNTTQDWQNSPTKYIYQWQQSDDGVSNWSNVIGKTNSDLLPMNSLLGKFLRCDVIGSNAIGSGEAQSDVVGPVIAGGVTTGSLTGYWS